MEEMWSVNDMPDQQGKVVIVTGGNSGLGFQSVKVLAQKGATVILLSRSLVKGEQAKALIGDVKGEVVVSTIDLESPASIDAFVKAFKNDFSRLDVLINNAGIMIPPYRTTALGVESQMAINHLGHFRLTGQLMELIVKTPQARVVTVSSLAHRKGVLDFTDINYNSGQDYDPMVAYRRSKLANLLFAYELQRFFDEHSINGFSVAAHPGVVPTNLVNHTINPKWEKGIRFFAELLLHPPAAGALPQLRAATDVAVKGGTFYGPSGLKEWRGLPAVVASSALSHDLHLAHALWHYSETVTGMDYASKLKKQK